MLSALVRVESREEPGDRLARCQRRHEWRCPGRQCRAPHRPDPPGRHATAVFQPARRAHPRSPGPRRSRARAGSPTPMPGLGAGAPRGAPRNDRTAPPHTRRPAPHPRLAGQVDTRLHRRRPRRRMRRANPGGIAGCGVAPPLGVVGPVAAHVPALSPAALCSDLGAWSSGRTARSSTRRQCEQRSDPTPEHGAASRHWRTSARSPTGWSAAESTAALSPSADKCVQSRSWSP